MITNREANRDNSAPPPENRSSLDSTGEDSKETMGELAEFAGKCARDAVGLARAVFAELDHQRGYRERAEAVFVGFGEQLARAEGLLAKGTDWLRAELARVSSR